MCLFKRFFNLEKQVSELATKVDEQACKCNLVPVPAVQVCNCDEECDTIRGLKSTIDVLSRNNRQLETNIKNVLAQVYDLRRDVDRYHKEETIKMGVPFYGDDMDVFVLPEAVEEFGKVAAEYVMEHGLEYVPTTWNVIFEDRVYKVHLNVADVKEFIEIPFIELLKREDTFFYVMRRIVL